MSYQVDDLFDFEDGYSFKSEIYTNNNQDIKLIRIQDVNQIKTNSEVFIPLDFSFHKEYEKNEELKKRYLIRNGDYLLSLSGAAGFKLSKWEGKDAYLNQRVTKVIVKNQYKNIIDGVLLESIFFTIKKQLNKLGKGQNNNLSSKDLAKVKININLTTTGVKDLIDKYEKIQTIKIFSKITKEKILTMDNSIINFENNYHIEEYPLLKLIDIGQTNRSWFTQKYINDNKGNIPVYGASEFDIPSYGHVLDNLKNVKYFNNCFTWNIDGSVAVFFRIGKFSLSEKVIPFFLKENFVNKILPEYLVIKIYEVAKKSGFSRSNKFGGDKLLQLKIKMIDIENYSLEEQRKIVEKYKLVNAIKENLMQNLDKLID